VEITKLNSDDQPLNITTHGDFSPGIVYGDYIVRGRSRKPGEPPPFNLPQQDTPNFVGRIDQLEKLEQVLLQPGTHKMAGIVGVAGTGGIGKSALACHFAEKHRDKFPDGVIGIRVNDKDVDNIAREFARLYGEELEDDDTRNAATIMQDVFAAKRVLLIIDNAEIADIRELHPGGQECAIIVTTRDRSLPSQIDIPDNQLIDLPVLPLPEALDLLARFVDQEKLGEERDAVNRILTFVGNLPLALEIVGKSLRNRLRHFPDFKIDQYADALNLDRLKLGGAKHFNVRLCFYRSIKYLEDDGREDLINTFSRLSVCASSGFVWQTAKAAMDESDDYIAQDHLSELVDLSLLNLAQADTQRFIFHPLLQEFSRELAFERDLLKQSKQSHARYFIERVNAGGTAELVEDFDDIVNVAEWMAETKDTSYVTFWLKLRVVFNRLGQWRRANRIIAVFLKLSEENENWIAVAQFYIQQAKFNLLQGEFLSAEKMLKAIESVVNRIEPFFDQQRIEGMRLNTLGGALQRLGRFEEAVHAFERSGEIGETQADHNHLAMVLNSLGGVLQRLGRFEEAVQAFERSAKIEEAINNQRSLAMVLNSLGGVLQRLGRFEEAVQAFERSYPLLVESGDERGQAMVLNSLGGVLDRLGRFDEAVKSFEQSIVFGERLNDEMHLAKVHTSYGKALLYYRENQKAFEHLRKAFEIEERKRSLRGIAFVAPLLVRALRYLRRRDDAAKYLDRALKIAPNDPRLHELRNR
jgi:tetratricopeptide (TPR) repeat protein